MEQTRWKGSYEEKRERCRRCEEMIGIQCCRSHELRLQPPFRSRSSSLLPFPPLYRTNSKIKRVIFADTAKPRSSQVLLTDKDSHIYQFLRDGFSLPFSYYHRSVPSSFGQRCEFVILIKL